MAPERGTKRGWEGREPQYGPIGENKEGLGGPDPPNGPKEEYKEGLGGPEPPNGPIEEDKRGLVGSQTPEWPQRGVQKGVGGVLIPQMAPKRGTNKAWGVLSPHPLAPGSHFSGSGGGWGGGVTSSWLMSSMVPLERGSLMSCILQACSRLWRSLRFCSSFVSMAVTSFCRWVISLGGGGGHGGDHRAYGRRTERGWDGLGPAHWLQAPPTSS